MGDDVTAAEAEGDEQVRSGYRVAAVVLAAGGSTRMGTSKQLLSYQGVPLVRRAVAAALDAGASPVFVIVGAESARVGETVKGLRDVVTVENESWREGMASSIAAGIRAVVENGDADGCLVTLSDQPLVDAVALRSLLDMFSAETRIVAARYEGTLGVPAVFGREHFDDLTRLAGDAGARDWLRARAGRVCGVLMANAAVDIDTPLDALIVSATT